MKRMFKLATMPLVFMAVVSPLQAQVLNNEQEPLDSITQAYHDAVIAMRDTLLQVNSAAVGLTRGIQNTSPQVVARRAVKLRAACIGAAEAANNVAPVFDATTANPAYADLVSAVNNSLGELTESLNSQCVSVFNDGLVADTDSLASWAPYHTRGVQRLSRGFINSAYALAQAARFRIEARYTP